MYTPVTVFMKRESELKNKCDEWTLKCQLNIVINSLEMNLTMTDMDCFETVARETGEYDHVISDFSKP